MELSIKKDSPFLTNVIMPLIINMPIFAEQIESTFPEISADVVSFKNNPQCSCANKVKLFIEKHSSEVFDLLEDYFNKNTSLQQTINAIINGSSFYDVSGKVFEIDDTSEAYENFFKRTIEEKFNFRACNIVSKGDKLKIFFL